MVNLQNLTKDRTNDADRIIVPKEVSENNIGSVEISEVAQTLYNRLFSFNRCIIDFEDDNSHTYFELIDNDKAAIIRNVNVNNVYFSAIIQLDTVHISEDFAKLTYEVPDIKAAAFQSKKRVRLTEEQAEEVKKTLAVELLSVLCVFTYINNICLETPELETKTVKKYAKKARKGGNPVKYISTRKYVLTGQERKSRRNIPKVYTREQWQVRGHWRTYNSGKRVWIKPHESKRDKSKIHCKKTDQRVYKIGPTAGQ